MIEHLTTGGLLLAGLYFVVRLSIDLFFRRKDEFLRRLMNAGADALRNSTTGDRYE